MATRQYKSVTCPTCKRPVRVRERQSLTAALDQHYLRVHTHEERKGRKR